LDVRSASASHNVPNLELGFKKMNMPCDYITPVELEGEQGTVTRA
jgi:hypothetical protein